VKYIAHIAAAVLSLFSVTFGYADEKVSFSYSKCAHCLPVSMTPQFSPSGFSLETLQFNTGSDSLTALLTNNADVAQVTYIGFITAVDKGLDVVAVSGHVNGGSKIILNNDLQVALDDWNGLRDLIAKYKAEGKPFRVAASRGSAQDLHLRGALAKQGINVDTDTQFVNIPNPSDHAQALLRGEVELITTVEPFASQIQLSGAGKFFGLPYDQASGNLTGLIVTRSDVIKERPEVVQAAVTAWIGVSDHIAKKPEDWADLIVKMSGTKPEVAAESIKNLQPDYKMYVKTASAIADVMLQLKYVSKDVSDVIPEKFDFTFLEKATGKPLSELKD